MIHTKLNKDGHSIVAAIRKHAKFLRDEMGVDYLTALDKVSELYRTLRDYLIDEELSQGTINDGVTSITIVGNPEMDDNVFVGFSVMTVSYDDEEGDE